MRRPGFEPGFWAWKAQVIATRPSTHNATHLEVFVTYNFFAPRISLRERKNRRFSGSCDVIATARGPFRSLRSLKRNNLLNLAFHINWGFLVRFGSMCSFSSVLLKKTNLWDLAFKYFSWLRFSVLLPWVSASASRVSYGWEIRWTKGQVIGSNFRKYVVAHFLI
jgi:hypothetical protein